jgi:hypothetical protein
MDGMRWMTSRKIISALVLFGLAACAPKPPMTRPPVPVEPKPSVQGVWESPNKGKIMRMIFSPDGRLTFEGGMEFFNPGHWDLNPMQKELILTLPQASDEKLQIFKLSVGDGVKRFDREAKRVVYHFDAETSALNIAGWNYSKVMTRPASAPQVAPEPVLK